MVHKAMHEHSTTVSLVLGSGGARGLAHIGVIEWLIEHGYVIRSISGSSMGALIGGVYAAGKLHVYAEWVLGLERLGVVRLLDPVFRGAGLFKGERVMGVLRKLIGDCAIEELPISFTAVATDLGSGKEVWLREGRLFDAIRASIATPLLFTPFECRGRKLLDGALVNPIPMAPTLNDTTDLTVAVNLSGRSLWHPSPLSGDSAPDSNGHPVSFGKLPHFTDVPLRGMVDVALAAMDTMQSTIARLKLAAYSPDVTVNIPRNACGFHEFWRADEMIALGRERTEQAFTST
jgi:NTE family protein